MGPRSRSERLGIGEVGGVEGGGVQRERRLGHGGVVGGEARPYRLAVAIAVGEPAIAAHGRHDGAIGIAGEIEPVITAEYGAGLRQAGDHQAVPIGEDLVVERGRDPAVALGEQGLAQSIEAARVGVVDRRCGEEVGDRLPLTVAGRPDVVGIGEEGAVRGTEGGDDLVVGPDVVAALLAFGIGVEAGGEGAAVPAHVAAEPVDQAGSGIVEDAVAGQLPAGGEQRQKLGVVVEHLLEMWHQPAIVGRVAGEAAADVIVDAAAAERAEGEERRFRMAPVSRPQEGAMEKLDESGLRKLWRSAGAAMDGVDQGEKAPGREVEQGAVDGNAFGVLAPAEGVEKVVAVIGDGIRLLTEDPGDFVEDSDEGRAAEARLLREVGSAPDRRAVRRQEHGERPAALLAGGVERGHVYLVDVRPLLAIDLDVHEEPVHHRRGGGVLEALVGHDVAPVAGGVADGKQDGLAGLGCFGERRRSPGPPVDGIVPVLQEIGARLVAEEVLGWLGHELGCRLLDIYAI